MPTNFLAAPGYLSPSATPTTGTGSTHTNTTLDVLTFNPQTTGRSGGSLLKGQFVTIAAGGGGHAPDLIAAVASSTSITLLTATTATASLQAVSVYHYPVLIGGEASALTNGSAVTSSYWNNTGIFTQTHIDFGLQADCWFMTGGAFTPSLGGHLDGWFLESWDGGTNFGGQIATASATVPALARPPDFTIPLDNAAYAVQNSARVAGRIVAPLPVVPFKVRVQTMAGVTMPATWMVVLAPWAVQY
jgi:hypothetical protein